MSVSSRIGRDRVAVGAGLVAPFAVEAALLPLEANLVNTDVALILVIVVVGVAASGNRPAELPAAVSAAVWFFSFWTQPYETLAITTRADIETAVLLPWSGLAVTETGVRARRQHAAASREVGFRNGILSAAEAAATGRSPSALLDRVCEQLARLLGLPFALWHVICRRRCAA